MKIIGVLVIVLGWLTAIGLALYFGLWLMFIGGIIQLIEAIRADPVPAASVAWGVVRVIFAGFIASVALWGAGLLSTAVGSFLISTSE